MITIVNSFTDTQQIFDFFINGYIPFIVIPFFVAFCAVIFLKIIKKIL